MSIKEKFDELEGKGKEVLEKTDIDDKIIEKAGALKDKIFGKDE